MALRVEAVNSQNQPELQLVPSAHTDDTIPVSAPVYWPDRDGYTHEIDSGYTRSGWRIMGVLFPLVPVRIEWPFRDFYAEPGFLHKFIERWMPFVYSGLPTQPIQGQSLRRFQKINIAEDKIAETLGKYDRATTVLVPRTDLQRAIWGFVDSYDGDLLSSEARDAAIGEIQATLGAISIAVIKSEYDRIAPTRKLFKPVFTERHVSNVCTERKESPTKGGAVETGQMQPIFAKENTEYLEQQRFWERVQKIFDIVTFNYRPLKSEKMILGFIPVKIPQIVVGGAKEKTKYIDPEKIEKLPVSVLKILRKDSEFVWGVNEEYVEQLQDSQPSDEPTFLDKLQIELPSDTKRFKLIRFLWNLPPVVLLRNVDDSVRKFSLKYIPEFIRAKPYINSDQENVDKRPNSVRVNGVERVDRDPNFRETLVLFFRSEIPKFFDKFIPKLRYPEWFKEQDDQVRIFSAKVLCKLLRVDYYKMIAINGVYGDFIDYELRENDFRQRVYKAQDIPSTTLHDPVSVWGHGKAVNGKVKPLDDTFARIMDERMAAIEEPLEDYVVIFTPDLIEQTITDHLLLGEIAEVNMDQDYDLNSRTSRVITAKVNACKARIFRTSYFVEKMIQNDLDSLGYTDGRNTLRVMSLKRAVSIFPGGISISGMQMKDRNTIREFVSGSLEEKSPAAHLSTVIDLGSTPLIDEEFIYVHNLEQRVGITTRNNETRSVFTQLKSNSAVLEWVDAIRVALPSRNKKHADQLIDDIAQRIVTISKQILPNITSDTGLVFPEEEIEKIVFEDILDIVLNQLKLIKDKEGQEKEFEALKSISLNKEGKARVKFLQKELEDFEANGPIVVINDDELRSIRLVDRLLGFGEYNDHGGLSAKAGIKTYTKQITPKVEAALRRKYGYDPVEILRRKQNALSTKEVTDAYNNLIADIQKVPVLREAIQELPNALRSWSTLFSVVIGIFTLGRK